MCSRCMCTCLCRQEVKGLDVPYRASANSDELEAQIKSLSLPLEREMVKQNTRDNIN